MKDNNENIQTSVLFDDSISCINTSSDDSNIVHKHAVTSTTHNNSKNTLNKIKPQQRNIMVSFV